MTSLQRWFIIFTFCCLHAQSTSAAGTQLVTRDVFTDNYTATAPTPCANHDVTQEIVAFIQSATVSLDVATSKMDCPAIYQAIIDAHVLHGVGVRVIFETDNLSGGGGVAYTQMAIAGIDVAHDGHPSIRMNNNFIVADDDSVFTGGVEFSVKGITLDMAHGIAVYNNCVAELYTLEFDEMWRGDFGVNSPTTDGWCFTDYKSHAYVSFSPTDDTNAALHHVINQAQEEIVGSWDWFTDATLADSLVMRHLDGVYVRGTMDAYSATSHLVRDYHLCSAGIPIRVEDWSGNVGGSSIVIDPYRHDDGVPIVVLSSRDWNDRASTQDNNNTLFVFDSHDLARGVAADLMRLYNSLTPMHECNAQSISPESGYFACNNGLNDNHLGGIDHADASCAESTVTACYDGFDNDGDGLVDMSDANCWQFFNDDVMYIGHHVPFSYLTWYMRELDYVSFEIFPEGMDDDPTPQPNIDDTGMISLGDYAGKTFVLVMCYDQGQENVCIQKEFSPDS